MSDDRFEKRVNKNSITEQVNKKMRRAVFWLHTRSVVSILLEEIYKDLVSGKSLRIFNFGEFELKPAKPRKYHDFRFKKIMETKGKKYLKFTFIRRIVKKICSHLDIDKTFEK
jgi:nucleoid DNA-binding protein